MSQSTITSVRGMRDVLPEQSDDWVRIHQLFSDFCFRYGYIYVQTPIVEKTPLFLKGIGAETDISQGEMYQFIDKGNEHLCLRPEGTASMVRMAMQHGLSHHQLHKLFYHGPMFRRERPQKGRYRQFHQLGVEAFGDAGYWVELEQIVLIKNFLETIGIKQVGLHINSLGDRKELGDYSQALHRYFSEHSQSLSPADRRRLDQNPVRILDSKDPSLTRLIAEAPDVQSFLGRRSRQRFENLLRALERAEVSYRIEPRLVRGLEYYSHTVFEWIDTADRQSQNTLVAGGRYDDLATMIGSREPLAACGFAAGVERLLDYARFSDNIDRHICLIGDGDDANSVLQALAQSLRSQPHRRVSTDFSPRRLNAKIKDSHRRKVDILLVLGARELELDRIQASFPTGRFDRFENKRILVELRLIEQWLNDLIAPER